MESASDAFFFFKLNLWDGLGGLNQLNLMEQLVLAVYNSVYTIKKQMGYPEAQAQSDAAYQALEIINFGRRGL